MNSRQSSVSGFLFSSDRLEVLVDLVPVAGRRFVVGARGEPIVRLLGLQLLRQRGLDVIENLRRLATQLLPFREVLLERFRTGRRYADAGRRLEGEAATAAAHEARIVAAHLVGERLGLLQLPLVLFAELLEIGPVPAAAAGLTFAAPA